MGFVFRSTGGGVAELQLFRAVTLGKERRRAVSGAADCIYTAKVKQDLGRFVRRKTRRYGGTLAYEYNQRTVSLQANRRTRSAVILRIVFGILIDFVFYQPVTEGYGVLLTADQRLSAFTKFISSVRVLHKVRIRANFRMLYITINDEHTHRLVRVAAPIYIDCADNIDAQAFLCICSLCGHCLRAAASAIHALIACHGVGILCALFHMEDIGFVRILAG